MRHYPVNLFCLFLSLTLTPTAWCDQPTPGPQINTRFTLPLADQTTAEAVILPTTDGAAVMVYATKSGRIAFWQMTTTDRPLPPDPKPTPPPPARPLSIITITPAVAATLPTETASQLAAIGGSYYAYTVAMVATENPPPNSLSWIGRTAGKTLPYTFLATADGVTVWEGPTPANATAFIDLLNRFTKPAARPAPCAGGRCHIAQE